MGASESIESAYQHLDSAAIDLRDVKPNDHSDKDRRFAIVLTELEKLQAIMAMFLMAPEDNL